MAILGSGFGAPASLFPAAGMTKQFLTAQARGKDFKPLAAETAAEYDDIVDIDLGTIEPLIACPSSPDNVKAVSEVAGTEVAQVAVGSSVNSSFRDLSLVAHALDGKHVAAGISMAVSPGSRQTLLLMLMSGLMTKLIKAGVRELEVACGPCIGMGFAPPTKGPSVRTFNRNFEGRSGTADDLVYLCSPETAAATSVRGVITDPRELGRYPALKEPTKYPVDTSGFEYPPKNRAAVQIIRGPNIAPLPVAAPPKDAIEGEVLLRLGDNISTDHIMPAGAKILPLRSNIPAIAEHVFEYLDPTFPERARKAGGGFIVAGDNYGQGSSREHAAVAPMFLGVQLVLAKSFARIHLDNLVNSGIPPVTFANPKDYDGVQQGDRLRITNVLAAIRGRGEATAENVTRGTRLTLRVSLRPYQREGLLAGGGIRYAQSRVPRGGPAGLSRGAVISAPASRSCTARARRSRSRSRRNRCPRRPSSGTARGTRCTSSRTAKAPSVPNMAT